MTNLFFKVLKKAGLKDFFNFHIPRTVNKRLLKIPVLGEIGKGNLKRREKWMYDLLKKVLPIRPGLFVDVGVNIGQTLIHYKTIEAEGEYIGFEPNPVCVYYIHKLISANKWNNCSLVPSGIYSRSGLVEINYYSGATDSMATLVKNFRDDRVVTRKEMINCINEKELTTLLSNRFLSVIKIDVEGSELDVIKQLKSIITEKRPFVIAELLPPKKNDAAHVERINDIHALFAEINYTNFRIVKNNDDSLHKLQHINDQTRDLSRDTADHLFCPQEYQQFIF